jgi:hypothetical protein
MATFSATANVVEWTSVDDPSVVFRFVASEAAGGGGGVSDHGGLTGLADDDHGLYALADGTRGDFATEAQGALADTALQPGDEKVIPVVYFFRANTTRSTCTVVPGTGGAVFLPAGTPVLLDGQSTSSENGYYLADGSGGVDVGSKIDLKTVDYFGCIIVANFVWAERDGEDDAAFDSLEPYLSSRIGDDLSQSVYGVFSADGVTYTIEAFRLSHSTAANLLGKWFAPAMDDYSVSFGDMDGGGNYQLGLMHGITVVDSSGGDCNIVLGPHATIPRHAYIWHRTGDNAVTIENLPGDGSAFSYTLPRGEMVLILPDGASWHAWRVERAGPHMITDDGESAPWSLANTLIDHSHVLLSSVNAVGLPQASDMNDGHEITFYNESGAAMTLTIDAAAGDEFEGAATSVDVDLPPGGEVTVFRAPAAMGYEWKVDPRSAAETGYTPTTAGDWTEGVPDDVAEGLDTLAGRTPATTTYHEVAATGATESLTWAEAPNEIVHDITMDENCTISFGSPSGDNEVNTMTLILRGAFTPTLPASIDWAGGSAVTYGSPSVYEFVTVDNGTTVLGFLAGAALA